MKTYVYAKPCTQIFMVVLFVIARTLDCSFPMSKGFIVLPPIPNHQLQWVFTLRQVGKIQVGFVHFLQQQPLLSSSLHLQGKLSPTSCPVFLWFCVYVRPCGGWWRMACECEFHSYLQFLGVLYHHVAHTRPSLEFFSPSWTAPGVPSSHSLTQMTQCSCLFLLGWAHWYLDLWILFALGSQFSVGLNKSYDLVVYFDFFELVMQE